MVYIAHFRDNDESVHELHNHLSDVAVKCEEYGSLLGFGKLARLAGLLHDMGKYSDSFQEYIKSKMEDNELDARKKREFSERVDHGKIGALYIYKTYHGSTASIERLTAEILAMVICYHHGGLEDYITMNCKVPLLIRFERDKEKVDYQQSVERFFQEACSKYEVESLFGEACKEIKALQEHISSNGLNKSFSRHLLIKQLYSILIDSDRHDTYLYMANKQDNPRLDYISLWNMYSAKLEAELIKINSKPLETELAIKINELRKKVSDQCLNFAGRERGTYYLSVPTGGGKTLSSLRFALAHAKENKMQRIIYVLPYTTIIEQNAEVVRNAIDCDEHLLEHHSNVVSTEKDEEYMLLTQRWDSPIIFTTMVQFLNTFFEAGTSSIRRLHQINNSILIFDEIQSLPTKCISMFNDTVNYLNKISNCTVVLSSATLPRLDIVKKPILMSQEPDIIREASKLFENFRRMKVVPSLIEGGYSIEGLKNFILDIKKNQNSILCILNTKQAAEDVFKELKACETDSELTICLLSTNLCSSHRKEIIASLRKKLEAKEHVICISTQLIEAGVDISFEAVVRSLAGLDSIAQASGRGNRHGEGGIKETYIVNVQGESLRNLEEIRLGQIYTQSVLNDYQSNPKIFQNDLLSPDAISCYYKQFYKDIEGKMDYRSEKLKQNLYNVLVGITDKKDAYEEIEGKAYPFQLLHMFKTAAQCFRVIDDSTKAVLVPYGRGESLIADLISNKPLSEKIAIVKEVQQYCVNVFEYQYKKLGAVGSLAPSPVDGISILREGFYDKNLGIVEERRMDFLEK